MKRILCFICILIFTLMLTGVCFAATEKATGKPEINIPNANAPGAGQVVTVDMYPNFVPQSADIINQNIPASGELVQTGGLPAVMFYGAGGLCLLTVFILPKNTKKINK